MVVDSVVGSRGFGSWNHSTRIADAIPWRTARSLVDDLSRSHIALAVERFQNSALVERETCGPLFSSFSLLARGESCLSSVNCIGLVFVPLTIKLATKGNRSVKYLISSKRIHGHLHLPSLRL